MLVTNALEHPWTKSARSAASRPCPRLASEDPGTLTALVLGAALGAGTPPIPRRRLTREALAAALRRAVSDEGLRARAAALGAAILAEDGVREAVAHFERLR